ncbi:MAG: hypothetical protein HY586_04900, partial [Candidatus Omnitrophica bacterium]|nr:hypothetical protein [Candidatus Omnitrophota bacterium]
MRTIAFFTAFVFAAGTLSLPASAAAVTSFQNAPFIYLIQDAHDSLDAQANIRIMLKDLVEKEAIPLVLFEGGSRELDKSVYHFSQDAGTNQKVWDAMLAAGDISGLERYALEAPGSVCFSGIEDEAVYLANLEAINKVYGLQAKSAADIATIDARTKADHAQLVTGDVKTVSDLAHDFESHKIDLARYAGELAAWSGKVLGENPEDPRHQKKWPQMVRLLHLVHLENFITRHSAEVKREMKLVHVGATRRGGSPLQSLRRHFERVADELRSRGDSLRNYPHLGRWIAREILRDELDPARISPELARLHQTILDRLPMLDETRAFLAREAEWRRLKKICALEADRSCLSFPTALRGFLRRRDRESRIGTTDPWIPAGVYPRVIESGAGMTNIGILLRAARTHYRIVRERDQIFTRNSLEAIQRTRARKAVIVAGGFHTEAFMRRFDAEGIRYTVLTPSINELSRTLDYAGRISFICHSDPERSEGEESGSRHQDSSPALRRTQNDNTSLAAAGATSGRLRDLEIARLDRRAQEIISAFKPVAGSSLGTPVKLKDICMGEDFTEPYGLYSVGREAEIGMAVTDLNQGRQYRMSILREMNILNFIKEAVSGRMPLMQNLTWQDNVIFAPIVAIIAEDRRRLSSQHKNQLTNILKHMPEAEQERMNQLLEGLLLPEELGEVSGLGGRPLEYLFSTRSDSSKLGMTVFMLVALIVLLLKTKSFNREIAGGFSSYQESWHTEPVRARFVPPFFSGFFTHFLLSTDRSDDFCPENEIGPIVRQFGALRMKTRRDQFEGIAWANDYGVWLPDAGGKRFYYLKPDQPIQRDMDAGYLFRPQQEKFWTHVNEGGASVPGVGRTPFMIFSDSVDPKHVDRLKVSLRREKQISEYSSLECYRLPAGWATFKYGNEVHLMGNNHVDTVMGFIPARMTEHAENLLLIDPLYHEEVKIHPEFQRLLREQNLRVIEVPADETYLNPANFKHLPDGRLLMNYAPQTVAALGLKPDLYSMLPREEALENMPLLTGGLACLLGWEPITTQNRAQFSPVPAAEEPPASPAGRHTITLGGKTYFLDSAEESSPIGIVLTELSPQTQTNLHPRRQMKLLKWLSAVWEGSVPLMTEMPGDQLEPFARVVAAVSGEAPLEGEHVLKVAHELQKLPLSQQAAVVRFVEDFLEEVQPNQFDAMFQIARADYLNWFQCGIARAILAPFVVYLLKNRQYIEGFQRHWQVGRRCFRTEIVQKHFIPLLHFSLASHFNVGSAHPEEIRLASELAGVLETLKTLSLPLRRQKPGDRLGWAKDSRVWLPHIAGQPFYALSSAKPGDRSTSFQRLDQPLNSLPCDISEGGASVRGVAHTPFMLFADSIPLDQAKELLPVVRRLPGYEQTNFYRLPAGWITFGDGRQNFLVDNRHIDAVMGFIPARMTEHDRNILLVDPLYHAEVQTNPEFQRLLAEQNLLVIEVHPNETHLNPANFAELPDGRLFFNYAPETLRALRLKPGTYISLNSEQALRQTPMLMGGLGCLVGRELITNQNRAQFAVAAGNSLGAPQLEKRIFMQGESGDPYDIYSVPRSARQGVVVTSFNRPEALAMHLSRESALLNFLLEVISGVIPLMQDMNILEALPLMSLFTSIASPEEGQILGQDYQAFMQLLRGLPAKEVERMDRLLEGFLLPLELAQLGRRPVEYLICMSPNELGYFLGATVFKLAVLMVWVLKNQAVYQKLQSGLRSYQAVWNTEAVKNRYIPPPHYSLMVKFIIHAERGEFDPETEILGITRLLASLDIPVHRDGNPEGDLWAKDSRVWLPDIDGEKLYYLQPHGPKHRGTGTNHLFARQPGLGLINISEGGASIPGIGKTPFMLFADSLDRSHTTQLKAALKGMPGYELLRSYRLPAGWATFKYFNEVYLIGNAHIDMVMAWIPQGLTQSGKPALLIDPLYRAEMRSHSVFQTFIHDQQLRIVEVHPDETHFNPTNYVILPNGQLLFNYAPQTIARLGLKEGAFIMLREEEALQYMPGLGGGLGCLVGREMITDQNRAQFASGASLGVDEEIADHFYRAHQYINQGDVVAAEAEFTGAHTLMQRGLEEESGDRANVQLFIIKATNIGNRFSRIYSIPGIEASEKIFNVLYDLVMEDRFQSDPAVLGQAGRIISGYTTLVTSAIRRGRLDLAEAALNNALVLAKEERFRAFEDVRKQMEFVIAGYTNLAARKIESGKLPEAQSIAGQMLRLISDPSFRQYPHVREQIGFIIAVYVNLVFALINREHYIAAKAILESTKRLAETKNVASYPGIRAERARIQAAQDLLAKAEASASSLGKDRHESHHERRIVMPNTMVWVPVEIVKNYAVDPEEQVRRDLAAGFFQLREDGQLWAPVVRRPGLTERTIHQRSVESIMTPEALAQGARTRVVKGSGVPANYARQRFWNPELLDGGHRGELLESSFHWEPIHVYESQHFFGGETLESARHQAEAAGRLRRAYLQALAEKDPAALLARDRYGIVEAPTLEPFYLLRPLELPVQQGMKDIFLWEAARVLRESGVPEAVINQQIIFVYETPLNIRVGEIVSRQWPADASCGDVTASLRELVYAAFGRPPNKSEMHHAFGARLGLVLHLMHDRLRGTFSSGFRLSSLTSFNVGADGYVLDLDTARFPEAESNPHDFPHGQQWDLELVDGILNIWHPLWPDGWAARRVHEAYRRVRDASARDSVGSSLGEGASISDALSAPRRIVMPNTMVWVP